MAPPSALRKGQHAVNGGALPRSTRSMGKYSPKTRGPRVEESWLTASLIDRIPDKPNPVG